MKRQYFLSEINPDMKISDLIHFNYLLLLVLNRFGIPFGFAEKTIAEVCEKHNIDLDCFIYITQLTNNPHSFDRKKAMELNPASVLDYLQNSHSYFLEKRLPDLQQKLENILKTTKAADQSVILSFFNQYSKEVRVHMGYENKIVFPYIKHLLEKQNSEKFSIEEFQSHHSNIKEKLTDLNNILIKYLKLSGDNYEFTNLLIDLHQTEQDIDLHCFIEDNVLSPIMKKIETATQTTLKK